MTYVKAAAGVLLVAWAVNMIWDSKGAPITQIYGVKEALYLSGYKVFDLTGKRI